MRTLLKFFNRNKRLKMIWKVESNNRTSYLLGASHIFSRSFKDFFRTLLQSVEKVIFEGPLETEKMYEVIKAGIQGKSFTLYEKMDPSVFNLLVHHFTRLSLNKIIPSVRIISEQHIRSYYEKEISKILKNYRHWMAFFSLWYHFLDLMGWKNSIDLEVFHIANEKRKRIYYLETIQEQIEAMEGIPIERIIKFFEKVSMWEYYIKTYEKLYLKGAWKELISHTSDFPTRCESIIDKRDPILFNRMIPFLQEGNALIVIGTIHTQGIVERLQSEGFAVETFS